jgi:hypothetical protein
MAGKRRVEISTDYSSLGLGSQRFSRPLIACWVYEARHSLTLYRVMGERDEKGLLSRLMMKVDAVDVDTRVGEHVMARTDG